MATTLKLNIARIARPIVSLAQRSVASTGELAQALLRADETIRKSFKVKGERRSQRGLLTKEVLRQSRLSKDAKRSLSSTMSQVFRAADARASIRRTWLSGKYGRPHTIAIIKSFATKSTRRRPKIEPQQVAFAFVRNQMLNLFGLERHIVELKKLVERVRSNVARKSWKRPVQFDRNKFGLVLA